MGKHQSSTKTLGTGLDNYIMDNGFLAENLVEPETLQPISIHGKTIVAASGNTYSCESGVPVFMPSSRLTEHQQSELDHTIDYVQGILDQKNPHYSPEKPYEAPRVCWEWTIPWLNKEAVTADKKIICIGGSFADDLPHLHSDYKFNIDHLAHEYVKLLPKILEANTHYVAAHSEEMPFRSGYADIVYTRNCLDHVCNPVKTIEEIHRILKPDGRLFIGVYYNSTFVDEHESTVIDDEFIVRCIEPFFFIEHRNIVDAPQQEIFGNVKTGFIYLVCRKNERPISKLSPEQTAAVGDILASFHAALYYENTNKFELSAREYMAVLRQDPVFLTDNWRMLYSLIHFYAITNQQVFCKLFRLVSYMLGDSFFWSKILDEVRRRHAIRVTSAKLTDKELHVLLGELEITGVISGERILQYCARAVAQIRQKGEIDRNNKITQLTQNIKKFVSKWKSRIKRVIKALS